MVFKEGEGGDYAVDAAAGAGKGNLMGFWVGGRGLGELIEGNRKRWRIRVEGGRGWI